MSLLDKWFGRQDEETVLFAQAKVGELVLEVDVLKKAKRLFGQPPQE